ncbi:hypothetical protein [Deinococcus multiflagellatus]|uniref:Uncharacterized protein n=1 Tax=Deinococcus multiflagellatus TaxID=1656887 RepID=A0ABW1ZSJ6_9DEIO|nr:hypothetical protein [Deinococcus multiflagellatus]MBZ9715798.1 hypothetical protein [Deinococcus multiflagellatus]
MTTQPTDFASGPPSAADVIRSLTIATRPDIARYRHLTVATGVTAVLMALGAVFGNSGLWVSMLLGSVVISVFMMRLLWPVPPLSHLVERQEKLSMVAAGYTLQVLRDTQSQFLLIRAGDALRPAHGHWAPVWLPVVSLVGLNMFPAWGTAAALLIYGWISVWDQYRHETQMQRLLMEHALDGGLRYQEWAARQNES